MSLKNKNADQFSKRKKQKKHNTSESDNSSSDEEMEEVTVDFSGFELAPCDFNGIQLLLQQLFLKNHLDLKSFTDFLIDGQPDIGIVIKESEIDETSNDNEDDTVYGLITVVNLSLNKDLKFVSQLKEIFSELSKEHATEKTKDFISSVLNEPNYSIGFIINERYSNLPPVISVPSLTKLKSEIDRKSSEDPAFKFTHFVLMCKLYKVPTKKKKNNNKNFDIIWCNAEDEVIDKEADARFEYAVTDECDSGLAGTWTEDDIKLIPYRRVLVFTAHKFDSILNEVSEFVK